MILRFISATAGCVVGWGVWQLIDAFGRAS